MTPEIALLSIITILLICIWSAALVMIIRVFIPLDMWLKRQQETDELRLKQLRLLDQGKMKLGDY